MDRQRMLEMCRRDQWTPDDLDWTRPPPRMDRDKEEAVCQFFTDMAGIERLAGALFDAQSRKTDDPVLREIFRSFVGDEIRHAEVAERLARYYDVHRHREYRPNRDLLRFAPHFVRAIEYLTPDIANAYITTGELLLDVALLRSLDDYVADAMSHQAMRLINRDESRHIAVDFHMVEFYSSDAYVESLKHEPAPPWPRRAQAWWAFGHVLWHARPFFRRVFFEPMDRTDPTGRRLIEAFKRIQLLTAKPDVRRRPFVRFILTLQTLYNHPLFGLLFGRVLLRAMGVDPRVAVFLYTPEELERAYRASFDDLAAEALAAKFAC